MGSDIARDYGWAITYNGRCVFMGHAGTTLRAYDTILRTHTAPKTGATLALCTPDGHIISMTIWPGDHFAEPDGEFVEVKRTLQ